MSLADLRDLVSHFSPAMVNSVEINKAETVVIRHEHVPTMRHKSFLNPPSYSTTSGPHVLAACVNSAIKTATARLRFTHPVEVWQNYYVFPQEVATDVRLMSRPTFDSHESAAAWVGGMISECFLRNYNYVVRGDVGSGKTSLFKYLLRCHGSEFNKIDVIPTRVECRRSIDYSNHDGEYYSSIVAHVKLCCVRDVIHRLVCDEWLDARLGGAFDQDGRVDAFIKLLKKTARQISVRVSAESINKMSSMVRQYAEAWRVYQKNNVRFEAIENRKFIDLTALVSDCTDDAMRGIVIKAASSVGYRFMVVFDGYDIISPADMLHAPDGRLREIEAIARIAKSMRTLPDSVVSFSNINIRYVSIMRHATVPHYLSAFAAAPMGYSSIQEIEVVPADHNNIVKKRMRCLASSFVLRMSDILPIDAGQKRDDLFRSAVKEVPRYTEQFMDIYGKIIAAVSDHLGVNIDPPERIFNNNMRALLAFVRIVLNRIIDHSVDGNVMPLASSFNKGVEDLQITLLAISGAVDSFLEHKAWRLIEILASGERLYFKNYIAGGVAENGEAKLKYDTNPSPFFDNIFEYTFRTSGSTSVGVLTKLRVLQIVDRYASPGAGLSFHEIHSRLAADFGYIIAQNELKVLLIILALSESLSAHGIEPDLLTYEIEPKGKFLANSVMYQMGYLELVCYQVAMPRKFSNRLIYGNDVSSRLSRLYSVYRGSGAVQWIVRSIVNCFVLYAYIAASEKMENRIKGYEEVALEMGRTLQGNIGAIGAKLLKDGRGDVIPFALAAVKEASVALSSTC
ncbi:protein of unknown function [Magnetospirillum sp. XM-1]|uniref:hypothetical protein n=1 Tax=Magnetospirillum sp. XM-1 TaxID=1663591 RepID=UPI00073E0377|nr:hypothetical protein [Magnetospirillum sp. XM-1]CUW38565.1 protein of unknown function [Magnetospirillum sp. XM-1]